MSASVEHVAALRIANAPQMTAKPTATKGDFASLLANVDQNGAGGGQDTELREIPIGTGPVRAPTFTGEVAQELQEIPIRTIGGGVTEVPAPGVFPDGNESEADAGGEPPPVPHEVPIGTLLAPQDLQEIPIGTMGGGAIEIEVVAAGASPDGNEEADAGGDPPPVPQEVPIGTLPPPQDLHEIPIGTIGGGATEVPAPGVFSDRPEPEFAAAGDPPPVPQEVPIGTLPPPQDLQEIPIGTIGGVPTEVPAPGVFGAVPQFDEGRRLAAMLEDLFEIPIGTPRANEIPAPGEWQGRNGSGRPAYRPQTIPIGTLTAKLV